MYLLVQIATALACTIRSSFTDWRIRFARPVVVWLRAVVAGALADDLESQLKDLQEVNETTVNNLIHTEKQLEQVRRDDDALREPGLAGSALVARLERPKEHDRVLVLRLVLGERERPSYFHTSRWITRRQQALCLMAEQWS